MKLKQNFQKVFVFPLLVFIYCYYIIIILIHFHVLDKSVILSSECTGASHVIQKLGPVWAGELFEVNYLEGMVLSCENGDLKEFLKLILEEAMYVFD